MVLSRARVTTHVGTPTSTLFVLVLATVCVSVFHPDLSQATNGRSVQWSFLTSISRTVYGALGPLCDLELGGTYHGKYVYGLCRDW